MKPFDRLVELFESTAATGLYGEDVTIAEHMLQTAALAEAATADDAIVVAALLHDIGHLVAGDERDQKHAAAGAAFLSNQAFPATVVEPVRLHVAAKRYLVATEPDYADKLSPASVRSLGQQGGPFGSAECEAFLAEPFRDVAIGLRRWDEGAKIAGHSVPPLRRYRDMVERLGQNAG